MTPLWTFYLHVYKDKHLLRPCLNALRKVYPQERLVIRSDNDPDPEYASIAKEYAAEYILGAERLYSVKYGGKLAQVMFDIYSRSPTDFLVKIDPDTLFVRPITRLPYSSQTFGNSQEAGGLWSLQGGFFGFSRKTVNKLYESKLLLSKELQPPISAWATNTHAADRISRGLTSFDWSVGWAMKQLGITMDDHEEVHSTWGFQMRNFDGNPAIVHPWIKKDDNIPVSSI